MGIFTEEERAQTDDLVFICRGCRETFEMEYHVCPECGGYRVERDRNHRLNESTGVDQSRLRQWAATLKQRFTIIQMFDESNTDKLWK